MGRNPIYKFCSQCGGSLQTRVVEGKERPYCVSCDRVYYPDLKVAAAVLVVERQKLLLVKRAMMPNRGYWSLPAGFIDAGEDPQDAAERECLEETGLQVTVTELISLIPGQEHPRGAHLVILYRAKVVGGELAASDDASEAAFFGPDELPPLAFDATKQAVEIWLSGLVE